MRYSYEFKLMCVDLYQSGIRIQISPEGANPDERSQETCKRMVMDWLIYMVQKF